MKLSLQQALQNHHDYYVKLFQEGKIDSNDPNYRVALQREKEGTVKPLKALPTQPPPH